MVTSQRVQVRCLCPTRNWTKRVAHLLTRACQPPERGTGCGQQAMQNEAQAVTSRQCRARHTQAVASRQCRARHTQAVASRQCRARHTQTSLRTTDITQDCWHHLGLITIIPVILTTVKKKKNCVGCFFLCSKCQEVLKKRGQVNAQTTGIMTRK